MRGNAGASRLAGVLQRLIAEGAARADIIELGTIQDDMSLLPDRFQVPIPKGEYLVARHLTLQDPMTQTAAGQGTHPHGPSGAHAQYSGDGVHSHPDTEGAHVHDVNRPAELAPLAPGDRVLIAWANDGTDPVVIDVVLSS